MGIFSSIAEAIFGKPAQAATAPQVGASTASGSTAPAGSGAAGVGGTAPQAVSNVDVAKILDRLDEESDKGDLDWRKSIVDLMKLLDLDSSLGARKALADELGFKGDKGDSASMNIWLHKQVMTKLAANGGIVPADLRD